MSLCISLSLSLIDSFLSAAEPYVAIFLIRIVLLVVVQLQNVEHMEEEGEWCLVSFHC